MFSFGEISLKSSFQYFHCVKYCPVPAQSNAFLYMFPPQAD